ncbi:MAG: carboxypeptidase regulatory-like domain-containing protein [Bryobacteraceae bacterium]|nr:carboxypeptidase regulatory-like domain-containing protein [Bryobacteraceae bacterium]
MFSRLFLILFSVVLALSQPVGTGAVSGIVISQSSGEPLRKTIVTLTLRSNPVSWAIAATDGSGRFRFDSLPAGVYDLRAAKDSYTPAAWGADSYGQLPATFTLAEGENRGDFRFRMVRSAQISGVVLDTDGDPLAGAEVAVFKEGYPRGIRELVPRNQSRTDDRGEYRLILMEPGRYYISADSTSHMGYGRMGASPGLVHIKQFYGGATDWKKAAPITIGSGDQVRGLDFRLNVSRALSLKGVLRGMEISVSEPGSHPVFANIELVNLDSMQTGRRIGTGVSPDGHFQLAEVPPGRYKLTGTQRIGNKTLWASQKLDLQSDPGEIVLTLGPGIDLKGQLRVEGEGGGAITQFAVNLTPGDFRGMRGPISAKVGPDGRFTLPQVPPGVWDIGASPVPKGGFIKSMRLGEHDVLTEEMEIGPDTSATLNLVVSTRGAKVEGKVEGGKRNLILLAPVGKHRAVMSFFAFRPSNDDGTYSFAGITPGKYKIFAFEMAPPGDPRNPDLVEKLAESGQTLDIVEGATVAATPKSITADQIKEALQ